MLGTAVFFVMCPLPAKIWDLEDNPEVDSRKKEVCEFMQNHSLNHSLFTNHLG